MDAIGEADDANFAPLVGHIDDELVEVEVALTNGAASDVCGATKLGFETGAIVGKSCPSSSSASTSL